MDIVKKTIEDIKSYVKSLDTPDNDVYKQNSLLIKSCFSKAMEILEENEKFFSGKIENTDAIIKELGESYHDRLCMSIFTCPNQKCECCNDVVSGTTVIEHDSADKEKDKSICHECYLKLYSYWRNNHPLKLSPI